MTDEQAAEVINLLKEIRDNSANQNRLTSRRFAFLNNRLDDVERLLGIAGWEPNNQLRIELPTQQT